MATGWGRRARVDYMSKNLVNQTPSGPATTWFVSLHTANPGDDGQTAGEVTTTTSGYARQGSITWNTLTAFGSLTVDTASVASNSALITFGPSAGANAAWGTITYAGLWEKSTGSTEAVSGGTTGGFLGRALASSSQSVGGTGISITIAASALTFGIISA
jgi:hypothetical protein